MKQTLSFLICMLVALLLSSCKALLHQPMEKAPARLGAVTPLNSELISLPLPKEPMVAAVYKFRDHTGQYKPSETGANWSTAVTQGATSILIRALEESNWFVPIERENLSNLLNERKIIRSSRSQYQKEPAPLPALLFAGVVLEGGIISYESNVITGGAGLRYFGAGASGQYREDKVTVYLRAVSTSNGKILKTVYTSKTILSQVVDVGFFRFVKFERLLEAETGFTYNEPSDLAVTEAIEKAVLALVVEGASEGLWSFRDSTAWSSPVVTDFLREKEQQQFTDEFGFMNQNRPRGTIGLGINAGGWLYAGDYANPVPRPSLEGSLSLHLSPKFHLNFNVGTGNLAIREGFDRKFVNTELLANWRFFPNLETTPFIFAGPSMLTEGGDFPDFSPEFTNYSAVFGLGIEHSLGPKWDLSFSGFNSYSFSDELDGLAQGLYNDFYWGAKIGVKFNIPPSETKE